LKTAVSVKNALAGLKSVRFRAEGLASQALVSSISARVNGFEITWFTAVLFLEKTVSLPAPVMITTRVRGRFF
jgi:hypothetical protein